MTNLPPRAQRRSKLGLIYDQPIDVKASNDSHALMLKMIPRDCRVLEYGCATGRMTEIMRDRGCAVTGIEINPEAAALARRYAEAVHVIDLDSERASQRLAGQSFDVLVFGDVLEHLRDPGIILKDALKLLSPSGSVVISVPNMAHGDLRLALLEGQVNYGDWGLLDRTHLRWFTRNSLEQMLADAGLEVLEWQRTVRGITESEIAYDRAAVPKALLQWLGQQPEATTYQFVVRAQRRRAGEPAPLQSHSARWAELKISST